MLPPMDTSPLPLTFKVTVKVSPARSTDGPDNVAVGDAALTGKIDAKDDKRIAAINKTAQLFIFSMIRVIGAPRRVAVVGISAFIIIHDFSTKSKMLS